MRILLVTTLPNRVHQTLSNMPKVGALTIIDMSGGISRQGLFEEIASALQRQSYDLLLTYRCPYILPEDIIARFKVGLNIHPLSLPAFAGLNPWESFFRTGQKQATAVMHDLTALPDSGKTIAEECYDVPSAVGARDAADSAASRLIKKYILSALCEARRRPNEPDAQNKTLI